jgi:hypothetical protein
MPMSQSPKIQDLRKRVTAFFQEVDILIGVHEAWRPMVESEDLHKQMGRSFATHTFEFIRLALRARSHPWSGPTLGHPAQCGGLGTYWG